MIVNGWTLLAHPLFVEQLTALTDHVERLRERDAAGFAKKAAAKRLGAIQKLAFDIIPADPQKADYRLRDALGEEYHHWFRAKFFQQHRLFFRYSAATKLIIYAWVNDEGTKRAYESNTDAYRVFAKMLERGNPPDTWDALLRASAALDK